MTPQKKLQHIRESAGRRGIKVTLTVDDVAAVLAKTSCAICGATFDGGAHRLSFDRIDALAGYTRRNVRAACVTCNATKGRTVDKKQRALLHRSMDIRSVARARDAARVARGFNG